MTTVTTFSKMLAAVLFIIFPLLGFYLGMKYNSLVNISTEINKSYSSTQVSEWKKFTSAKNRISFSFPPEINLISEESRQNEWSLFLTSSNSVSGKNGVSIQIEVLDGTEYELPYTGKVIISKKNLEPFLGKEGTKGLIRGYLRSRPTSKKYETIYKDIGYIIYRIFDNDRLITVTARSTDVKKIPYYILDKIIASFRL